MLRLPKQIRVWAAMACLVAAQLHICADLDPCLWYPGQAHHAPAHGSAGHGCQACSSGSWAMTTSAPNFTFTPAASPLHADAPRLLRQHNLAEARASRAPPEA